MEVKRDKLKFDCIILPDKCYVKLNSGGGYYASQADKYVINGNKPKPTFKSDWFEIEKQIEKVEKLGASKKVNQRYELKAGYPVSELTPAIIDDCYMPDKYEAVAGLYSLKYDEIPAEMEQYEFEVNVIATRDEKFKFPKSPVLNVTHELLEQIESHPDLLFERPCSIGGKVLYEIVRSYLQENVDNKYARLDGNYSWRIKVDKRIKLAKTFTTSYDANKGTRKRTPRWIETLHTDKLVTVVHFEDSSSTKTFPPTIYGDSLEDLMIKLNEYLGGLVKMCNEPYKECECCGGNGVLLMEV